MRSPLFIVELKTKERYALNSLDNLKGEIGICIVEGSIKACGEVVKKENIMVSKVTDTCKTVVEANTHTLLFGGEPFLEERYIH